MSNNVKMEQCLFCLEETKDDNILIQIPFQRYYNRNACTCKIMTHVDCWMHYLLYKGRCECPICHRIYQEIAPPQGYIIVENPASHQVPVILISRDEPPSRCVIIIKRTSMIVICIFFIFFIIAPFIKR
jgi:hypothetical protein